IRSETRPDLLVGLWEALSRLPEEMGDKPDDDALAYMHKVTKEEADRSRADREMKDRIWWRVADEDNRAPVLSHDPWAASVDQPEEPGPETWLEAAQIRQVLRDEFETLARSGLPADQAVALDALQRDGVRDAVRDGRTTNSAVQSVQRKLARRIQARL